LPRIAFATKNREKYGITGELEQIRDEFKKYQEAKKKDKKLVFDQNKLQKLIELYKKVLKDSFGNDFDFLVRNIGQTIDNNTWNVKIEGYPFKRQ
jgi:5'-deoxynucleotidase YfbR-like HD superfamily hydrolase